MDQEQNVELRDDVAEGHDMKNAESQSVDATGKAADATSQSAPPTEPGATAKHATKKDPMPKTKAGMINAMYGKLNSMKKADLQASYGNMMGEEVEIDESDVVETAEFSQDLDALVESEATLSEEFKQKTAILFETALKSKLSEEVDRLEAQYKSELAEEVSSTKSDLVEKVDNYLNYVVETWMEDNKLAVQNGLRTEIAETFMEKMKDLFTESYIDVPESKVDLVDELAESVDELETKLNEQTQKVIDTTVELEGYKRNTIIREASRDLAETQVEKLKSLVEDVDFGSEESFVEKVNTIKESYFSKTIKEEIQEEIAEEADQTVEVSDVMASYLSTIRKTALK